MHLYQFDEVDSGLKLLPMAARRALDAAGIRLPLKSWLGLDLTQRAELTQLGSELSVDVPAVLALLSHCDNLERLPVQPEPSSEKTPQSIASVFGGFLGGAAAFLSGPVTSYVGPLPGGDAREHLAALTRHLEKHAPWGAQVTVTPGDVAPLNVRNYSYEDPSSPARASLRPSPLPARTTVSPKS